MYVNPHRVRRSTHTYHNLTLERYWTDIFVMSKTHVTTDCVVCSWQENDGPTILCVAELARGLPLPITVSVCLMSLLSFLSLCVFHFHFSAYKCLCLYFCLVRFSGSLSVGLSVTLSACKHSGGKCFVGRNRAEGSGPSWELHKLRRLVLQRPHYPTPNGGMLRM